MSDMDDKDKKHFRELFMFIILAVAIIVALVEDGIDRLEKAGKEKYEQEIQHDAGRSPDNHI